MCIVIVRASETVFAVLVDSGGDTELRSSGPRSCVLPCAAWPRRPQLGAGRAPHPHTGPARAFKSSSGNRAMRMGAARQLEYLWVMCQSGGEK